MFTPPLRGSQGEGGVDQGADSRAEGGVGRCGSKCEDSVILQSCFTFDTHTGCITCMAIQPSGTSLATGSSDMTIRIRNIVVGMEISVIRCDSAIAGVLFAPCGERLATSCWSSECSLWDFRIDPKLGNVDIQFCAHLRGHSDNVMILAVSQDSTRLATGGWDALVMVWNIAVGESEFRFTRHKGHITALCFDPLGTTLASSCREFAIRLWDLKSGLQRCKILLHTDTINSLHFSEDGSMLISASRDSSISLWSMASGIHVKQAAPAVKFHGPIQATTVLGFEVITCASDSKGAVVMDISDLRYANSFCENVKLLDQDSFLEDTMGSSGYSPMKEMKVRLNCNGGLSGTSRSCSNLLSLRSLWSGFGGV